MATLKFQKKLQELISEDPEIKSQFMEWMSWDGGATMVEAIVVEELESEFEALNMSMSKYINYLTPKIHSLIYRLNRNSSKAENNLVEMRLKAISEWIQEKQLLDDI